MYALHLYSWRRMFEGKVAFLSFWKKQTGIKTPDFRNVSSCYSPKHEAAKAPSTTCDCNSWKSVKSRAKSGRVRWPMQFIRALPFCLAGSDRWADSQSDTLHSIRILTWSRLGVHQGPSCSVIPPMKMFSNSFRLYPWISLLRWPIIFFATYCILRWRPLK
jgi:hypothetical protein